MTTGRKYVGPRDLSVPGYIPRQTLSDPFFKWRRNYAKRGSREVNILCVGDSILFGQGLSVGTIPDMTNYMDWLGFQLQSKLNGIPLFGRRNWVNTALADNTQFLQPTPGGYHVVAGYANQGGFADPWRLVGTAPTPLSRGVGQRVQQLATTTKLIHTADAATGFLIYVEDGASQLGQANFTIYSGDYSTTPTAYHAINANIPQNTGIAQYSVSITGQQLPVRGKYTIEIARTSGTPVLEAIYVVDGDLGRGVKVFNGAMGATLSSDWSANTTAANTAASACQKLTGYGTAVGFDMCILYIGANDYANNINPATFQTNLSAIITKYRAQQTRVLPFLIVSHMARYDVTTPTYAWPLYKAAMKAVALSTAECDYLDVGQWLPASQAADTDGDLIDSSDVHLTNAGQGLVAELIYQKLAFPGVM